jgi:HemY protein
VIRLASWIVFSLAVTALIAWMLSVPGTMTVAVGGFIAQPRLGVAVLLVLALVAIVIAIWAILRRLFAAPRALARRGREKRRERGINALSDAVIALHAGEPAQARELARVARQHLPANSAAQLVEAQAHLALGDMTAARAHYRELIGNPKTALAALSGLHSQARVQGRHRAALTFAQKAAAIAPSTGWAASAVFDDLVRRRSWAEAIDMTVKTPAASRDDKAKKRHRLAVLETALAMTLEAHEPFEALDHAMVALRTQSDFVPAALIAGRIEINRGETRRAMSLLRKVWRQTYHPDIATLYANSQPGASAVERFKRVRELIETPPADRSSAIVFARAAIDAYDWAMARGALAAYAADNPKQGVAMLMAEIEEGESADQGKAREWLARAVKAPPDPTWTADGMTSPEWEPVSPVTGRLDAFEWKVPVSSVVPSRAADAAASPAADASKPALPGA